MAEVKDLLVTIYTLVKLTKVTAALDVLFDAVDEFMENGDTDKCNTLCLLMDIDEGSIQLALGLLTATIPYRDRLDGRARFYVKVEKWLTENVPNRIEPLLLGLK